MKTFLFFSLVDKSRARVGSVAVPLLGYCMLRCTERWCYCVVVCISPFSTRIVYFLCARDMPSQHVCSGRSRAREGQKVLLLRRPGCVPRLEVCRGAINITYSTLTIPRLFGVGICARICYGLVFPPKAVNSCRAMVLEWNR